MSLTFTSISAPNEPAYALLAQIHRRAFEQQGDSVWNAAAFRQLLESPGVATCLVQDVDRPCGFYLARCVLDEAELLSIAIDPEFQGKGLSSVLMQNLIDMLMEQGITKLYLEVRKDNLPAIKLYQKMGLECTGERKNYYKIDAGKKMDALLFSLDIL